MREVIWIPAVFLPAPEIFDFYRYYMEKKIRKSSVIWGAVDIEGTPEVLTKLAIQVTTDMGDIDVSERLNGKVWKMKQIICRRLNKSRKGHRKLNH